MWKNTSGSFLRYIRQRHGDDMSKYNALWTWINENGTDSFKLTFAEIEQITGFPIDHSFLTYKKELISYGYQVGNIPTKEKTVIFQKT